MSKWLDKLEDGTYKTEIESMDISKVENCQELFNKHKDIDIFP